MHLIYAGEPADTQLVFYIDRFCGRQRSFIVSVAENNARYHTNRRQIGRNLIKFGILFFASFLPFRPVICRRPKQGSRYSSPYKWKSGCERMYFGFQSNDGKGLKNQKDTARFLAKAEEARKAAEEKRLNELRLIRKLLRKIGVAVSAGVLRTVGLRSDGTVVSTNYYGDQKLYRGECAVGNYRDIMAVSAGEDDHTVGVRSDGTVVAVGYNGSGQCGVSRWRLFVSVDQLKDAADRREKAEAARLEAARKKREALLAEQTDLKTELFSLKGLFTGKRRKEIEARLAEIEWKLWKLRNL